MTDNGNAPGLFHADVARIKQLISNSASQLVRSPLAVLTENVLLANGNLVIVLTVPKKLDKPYFDKNGVIWLKTGSDKRRVNSKAVNTLFHRAQSDPAKRCFAFACLDIARCRHRHRWYWQWLRSET